MNLGLAQLAFRRALAPAVVAAWILLSLLLLSREWAGKNALLEAAEEGGDPGSIARGMLREGAWTVLAISILPLLVFRAARTVSVWRSGESEWLASRGAGRGSILVSTWIGTWAGGAALLALSCLAIELRAGFAGPGSRSARRGAELALPASPRIDGRGPLEWTAPDPGPAAPPGSRARIEIGFVSGAGSAAEVMLRARRGQLERSSRVRVSSRGAIEVEIPPGTGAVGFELSCAAAGATGVVLSDAVEVWIPCASDRAGSAEILLRILLALAAWSALALGLGAWVSPSIAGAAILAAWLPAWLAAAAPAWLPGGDLWDAIGIAGTGRVPGALAPSTFAAGALLSAAGLALAAAGLSGRRPPA